MKKSLLLILLVGVVISCKTISVRDYTLIEASPLVLPPLELTVEMESLLSAYSLGGANIHSDFAGIATEPIEDIRYFGGNARQEITQYEDKRIQDAITLFESHLYDQVSDRVGKPIGRVLYRLPIAESRKRGWGWTLASIVTLTIPNWFGMPFANGRSEIQIAMDIIDCNDQLIASFKGVGFKKTPQALYHGYEGDIFGQRIGGNEDMVRKSNIEAIKQGLERINDQLSKDAERLRKQLLACQ